MGNFAELALPSGKRATLAREPRGYDMERAYDLAATHSGNMIALALALFAQSGAIDGARKTYEELRHELSALDAYQIALWTNGNFAAGADPADPGEGSVSPLG